MQVRGRAVRVRTWRAFVRACGYVRFGLCVRLCMRGVRLCVCVHVRLRSASLGLWRAVCADATRAFSGSLRYFD